VLYRSGIFTTLVPIFPVLTFLLGVSLLINADIDKPQYQPLLLCNTATLTGRYLQFPHKDNTTAQCHGDSIVKHSPRNSQQEYAVTMGDKSVMWSLGEESLRRSLVSCRTNGDDLIYKHEFKLCSGMLFQAKRTERILFTP
jgi:hypothetical protein